MSSLIPAFVMLMPTVVLAHEGLHDLLGLSHGPTSVSPLLLDLAGALLIAGGILLARPLWHRPSGLGIIGAVLLVAGAGLIAG